MAQQREKTVQAALKDLNGLTLTVIDGDFPPEILGRENLTFSEYRMPAGRNRPELYDAKVMGPPPEKQGALKVGWLHNPAELHPRRGTPEHTRTGDHNLARSPAIWMGVVGSSAVLLGGGFVRRHRERTGGEETYRLR